MGKALSSRLKSRVHDCFPLPYVEGVCVYRADGKAYEI